MHTCKDRCMHIYAHKDLWALCLVTIYQGGDNWEGLWQLFVSYNNIVENLSLLQRFLNIFFLLFNPVILNFWGLENFRDWYIYSLNILLLEVGMTALLLNELCLVWPCWLLLLVSLTIRCWAASLWPNWLGSSCWLSPNLSCFRSFISACTWASWPLEPYMACFSSQSCSATLVSDLSFWPHLPVCCHWLVLVTWHASM